MKFSSRSALLVVTCAVALFAAAPASAEDELAPANINFHVHPTRNSGHHAHNDGGTHSGGSTGTTNNGITYHGGPIMTGTTNVYYIWYGNWTGNTAESILPAFAENVGKSSWFNINTTYYNGSNTHVSNSVAFNGNVYDTGSQGTALTDTSVAAIVSAQLTSKALPVDPNGVYFVLTSKNVTETSGFCTQYCGWHNDGTYQGTNIKYAFIGDPDRCPTACEAQSVSPNGNPGADGMASIIGHELSEAVTDPDLNAWYDSHGEEMADKCAWTFGTVKQLGTGAYYNLTLGGYDFLIQRLWVNAGGGYCSMSY